MLQLSNVVVSTSSKSFRLSSIVGRFLRNAGLNKLERPFSSARTLRRHVAKAEYAELISNTTPTDRHRLLVEAVIRKKEARVGVSRCPRCWFPINNSGTSFCICRQLPELQFSVGVRFLVYMHHREFLNCGDDAKLLLCAAPRQTDIFVDGRPGDVDRLRSSLANAPAKILLFPSERAKSVQDYLAQLPAHKRPDAKCESGSAELSVVVLDGTWGAVKKLRRRLCHDILPGIEHVALQPETMSVYAREQTRKDGVCTVEALALLLKELGERAGVCEKLVKYVEVNNEALRFQHRSLQCEHLDSVR